MMDDEEEDDDDNDDDDYDGEHDHGEHDDSDDGDDDDNDDVKGHPVHRRVGPSRAPASQNPLHRRGGSCFCMCMLQMV